MDSHLHKQKGRLRRPFDRYEMLILLL